MDPAVHVEDNLEVAEGKRIDRWSWRVRVLPEEGAGGVVNEIVATGTVDQGAAAAEILVGRAVGFYLEDLDLADSEGNAGRLFQLDHRAHNVFAVIQPVARRVDATRHEVLVDGVRVQRKASVQRAPLDGGLVAGVFELDNPDGVEDDWLGERQLHVGER